MSTITPGAVLWITGLSGAGKTTIAHRAAELLRRTHTNVVFLDGDTFRGLVGDNLGHNADDRLANALRIARFCGYLGAQGIHVLVATMSLFPEVHAWNRANIGRYHEIYLRVPLDVVRARDPKGIYARADRGEARGVVGVDLPFVEPAQPDLVFDNAANVDDVTAIAERLLASAGLVCAR